VAYDEDLANRIRELVADEDAVTEELLAKPHAQPFEMRGRVIEGWLRVEAEGLKSKRQLERWVARGVTHARCLPPNRSGRACGAAARRARACPAGWSSQWLVLQRSSRH
jgi:hypothetical protein